MVHTRITHWAFEG